MLKGKKVVVLLIDSFGIGSSEDSINFGDQGSDTFGHIVEHRLDQGKSIAIPNLARRGLQLAAECSRNKKFSIDMCHNDKKVVSSKYGFCVQTSKGKDTPSGHWEIAGVPVNFDWHYFLRPKAQDISVFPSELIERWINDCSLKNGIIDAGHASGTEVIQKFGDEHCLTHKPILYTSADSVLQIACHEKHFGLQRLLDISTGLRSILDDMGLIVGRVIARPFVGSKQSGYERTGNRRDYSIPPPGVTLLEKIKQNNGNVIGIGKVSDIYAGLGITKKVKAVGLKELFDSTLSEYKSADDNTLIFTNFVDFDSSFGHRRDIEGYAQALEYFDSRLPELDSIVDKNTIVVVTADHGCDPSWIGTDHTREHVPFLLWGKNINSEYIGKRKTFADIGQTIAHYMGAPVLSHGESVFPKA